MSSGSIANDDLIHHHGYLVSRGLRPLALIGTVDLDLVSTGDAWHKLAEQSFSLAAEREPIPMVVPRSDGTCADVGYAARAWVVESFKWVMDNAPHPHRERLLGLLLGYSPDAIAAEGESMAGCRDLLTKEKWSEPTSPFPCPQGTE